MHRHPLPQSGHERQERERQHRPHAHTDVRTLHGSGQGTGVYFWTAGDENAKESIKQYFRKINSCSCALLHAERTPLVIAGVDYLLPLYWEVSRYPCPHTGPAAHADAWWRRRGGSILLLNERCDSATTTNLRMITT